MWVPIIVILVTLSATEATVPSGLCEMSEMERVRVEHGACTSEIRRAFLPIAISVQQNKSSLGDVCQIVNDTVYKCGKIYEKCYDDEGTE